MPRKLNEGDLVLKKVSQAQKDHKGKWAPNYEGPFVVEKEKKKKNLKFIQIICTHSHRVVKEF